MLDEARQVYDHRDAYRTAAQAIGYKEFFPYFEGTANLTECTEHLKQATRNYAKRQLTWFRRQNDAVWLYLDEEDVTERACTLVRPFFAQRGITERRVHREQPAGPPAGKKTLHALGLLALALFLLYVAVQFVLIFHRSYKTETAIRYTLAESLNLTGVVAFDAVDVPGSGDLGYLVQDGERVTNGTVVAECYTDDTQGLQRERLDRLERSITLLTKSQNSAGSELSVLTNQTKQALYNLLDKLDTAQYTGISDAQDSFLLAQNRLQISTGQTADFSQSIAALQTSTTASRHSSTRCRPSPPQRTAISADGRPRPPSGRTAGRWPMPTRPRCKKYWQTASRQRIQTAPDRSRRASAGNSTRSAIRIPPHGSTVCPR